MKTAYINGLVLDGKGNAIYKAAVLVEDDRIISVTAEDAEIPSDVTVRDISGKVLMPGMMDVHTHLSMVPSGNLTESSLEMYASLCSLQTYVNLMETCRAGFTTLRNVGGMEYCDVAVRTIIESGKLPGPRVIACGKALTMTGGTGEVFNRRFPWLFSQYQGQEACDGEPECRRAVRRQIWMDVDCIKVFASSGFADGYTGNARDEFSEKELAAIIDEATAAGRKVAVHCHTAKNAKICIRLGAASIEHGTQLDEEVLDLMVEHGTVWVPTALVYHNIAEASPEVGSQRIIDICRRRLESQRELFQLALRKGVKIALGTDAGTILTSHGSNAGELGIFHSWGMAPMECIRSATSVPAELLGIADITGSIEKGKAADLLIINGNPLEDIHILEDPKNILLVLRGGKPLHISKSLGWA